MKRFKVWFRFLIHGPAMINRIWRRFDELQASHGQVLKHEREETDALFKSLASEIADLRAAVAQMKVEQYEPPKPIEAEKTVVKCQTMKQFNGILEREREMAGDSI